MFLKKYYKIIIVIFIFLIIIGFIIFINFDILGHNGNRNNNDSKNSNNETTGYDIEYSDPIKEYYCLDDYTLSDNKCYSILVKTDALAKYSCEKGIAVGDTCDLGGIREFMSIPYDESNQEFKNDCIVSGGFYIAEDGKLKCKKWIDEKVPAKKELFCADGYKLSGDQCIYYSYIDALYKLTCEDGSILKDNKCEKYIYK